MSDNNQSADAKPEEKVNTDAKPSVCNNLMFFWWLTCFISLLQEIKEVDLVAAVKAEAVHAVEAEVVLEADLAAEVQITINEEEGMFEI